MNWKSIIATAVVTGIVTVLTGMILFWVQSKEPRLVYSTVESVPFEGGQEYLSIFQVHIRNAGKKSAEDVVLLLSLRDGEIQKSQLSINPTIKHQIKADKTSFLLEVGTLNPEEEAKASLLLNNTKGKTVVPDISLRAKGIKGVEDSGNEQTPEFTAIGVALLSAYAGIFAFFLSSARNRNALFLLMRAVLRGKRVDLGPNQKYVIASALALFGLPEKARMYLSASGNKQYWAEAELLAAEAILEKDPEVQLKYIEVLRFITEQARILDESKAIVVYSIARIYKSIGNSAIAQSMIDDARAIDRDQIEKRLTIDPLFSTKSLTSG